MSEPNKPLYREAREHLCGTQRLTGDSGASALSTGRSGLCRDMERPRKFYYWPSGLFFLVVASVAVEMRRRVSGRGQALSTVIKLIFEGLS